MRRIRYLMAFCVALALAGESAMSGALHPVTISPELPGPTSGKPAPGKFLVARRSLGDSHFGQTVVYLIEHDEAGTLGLIVNRPSEISLSEALPDLEDGRAAAHVLYYGGPVGLPVILILVRGESESAAMAWVADDVYIGTDRRVLDEVLAAKLPANEVRFYVGYSGWAAGQLDSELERESWYVVAADTNAIFSAETGELWNRLIERLEPLGIQVKNRRNSMNLYGLKH
jgi:putative transcriptional regulator